MKIINIIISSFNVLFLISLCVTVFFDWVTYFPNLFFMILRLINSLHVIYLISGVYNSSEINFHCSLTITSFQNVCGCLAIYGKVKSELIKVIIICHLYVLVTIHDDFNSAKPSSMQDACHRLLEHHPTAGTSSAATPLAMLMIW